MKKNLFSLGLIAAAAFTLTNCAQEIENPNQAPEVNGYPFEIVAKTVETKTVNEGMVTKWVAGDAITLFHAASESTDYSSNNKFTITEENLAEGKFTGELVEELAEYNDWYALYPYSDKIATPGAKTTGYTYIGYSSGLNQAGYDSKASLKGSVCPLYGLATEVEAGETPEMTMRHLSSVVELKVTNTTEEPLIITSASLTATEDIVGSYFIDITTNPIAYTASDPNYVKSTATVKVSGGTELAEGESACLYLAIKPFTAPEGEKLLLTVNGYEKELPLEKNVTFAAGKIKTINFAYDKEKVELPALSLPWYEDFSDEDLSAYNVVNGGSDTKVYPEDVLAGGEAGELLIGKTTGSFSVTVATGGYVGDFALTFKTNKTDLVTVECNGATAAKVSDTEYLLTVAQGVESFTLTIKNTGSSNYRIDDIEIAKPRAEQTLTFETTLYELVVANAASFTGQTVSGAKTAVTYSSNNEEVATVDAATGAVTMTGATGTAVITATAVQTAEYKAAVAAYTVKVSNPSATVTTKTVTYNFGTDTEVDFETWNSSYTLRTANYADATVKFTSANKQSSSITDMPVTKGQPVEIIMGDNRTLKSFNLTLKQWVTSSGTARPQTVTLHTSVDGGSTYTQTTTTSSTFALSVDELPAGTNAIKFTFSSSSYQVGIQSCELTFDVAE